MGSSQPEYTLIRSDRKTIGIQLRDGALLVRAPRWASRAQIDDAVRKHRRWIDTHMAQQLEQTAQPVDKLTAQGLQDLADQALKVIPARVRHYAPLIGVDYGRITIRNQRSRWGSCSQSGNLNFNCLLMLAPPEVLDSVVVHELCHRKEMNHSPRFYAEVLRVFPEYYRWNDWLKAHGGELLRRMTG